MPNKFEDNRGKFIKLFNEDEYIKEKIGIGIKEQYYSISKPGVLRGMHFQLPPMDQFKIVTCVYGEILDVVVDLRKNSKTYKKCCSFRLTEENSEAIYIPKGLAHGFYVTGNKEAIVIYSTETVYNENLDCGIRYDSIDFRWPFIDKPIMSKRDLSLDRFEDFNNPF